jgi:hypothetical protein
MSALFTKVPTQSRTSLRFAKAILSSPRTCPWFGLTSVVLKQSSLVSVLCAFPYRLFPVPFSARLRRCTASFQLWPVAPRTLPFLTPTRLIVCILLPINPLSVVSKPNSPILVWTLLGMPGTRIAEGAQLSPSSAGPPRPKLRSRATGGRPLTFSV